MMSYIHPQVSKNVDTCVTVCELGAHLQIMTAIQPLCFLRRWVAGQWSPCSATCAKGIQFREVACVYQLQNGTYINTRDLYCLGPKPAPVQSCEGRDCLSIWEASEWSKVGRLRERKGPVPSGFPAGLAQDVRQGKMLTQRGQSLNVSVSQIQRMPGQLNNNTGLALGEMSK